MHNFKGFFIFIVLFFYAFTLSAYSEVIEKVEVKGNERITTETIVVFGDITLGKNYEITDVNSLIKKLYETTFFSDISAEILDNKLTIVVKENPIIKSIVFNGEKATKFKDKLTEVISLREKGAYIENNIKNDISIIKEFYKSLGFYFVKIDGEIERLKKNRVNIVYTIEKGEKAKIAKIYFLGDKKIREKRLRDIITTQENNFWKVLSRNVYLNKLRVDLDKRLLENYYRNKGYYEVDVKSTNVEYSEGEGFVLTYIINAGKKYKFRKIFANISETLDSNAFESLEKEFNKLSGSYYSQKKLKKVLDEIDLLSEQKELQFINHNISETLDEDFVDVQINIFEGEKVIVERINIIGNSVTNDSVIRSELTLDEGDPFSTLLVNKSINNLRARNIFGEVKHEVLKGSSADLRVLQISVEEKATGEVMAGAGIGTDGTSFQFGVQENNWLGKGIILESTLNVSEQKISGNILVDNPNYGFTGNGVRAALDVSATDRTTSSGFKSSKTGFLLATNFEQWQKVYIAPEFTVTFEDIEVDSTASKSVKKQEGNFFNSDLGYSVTFDKRNQSFKPTKGYITTFSQSLPLIQDSSSISNGLNISSYKDFSEDVIGSLKFHGRAINGVDDDVRLTDRIFLPRNKLRGFNTYEIGPKDGSDWIGGNYAFSLSAETQLPNLLPEAYKTDFSVFIDTGNIWGVDYNDSVDDSNKLRSSIGASANIFTTIGPLSFTVAQALSKSSNDTTESFNFRLGTSF